MIKAINKIDNPPPELSYIIWQWIQTLDLWNNIDARLYVKSIGGNWPMQNDKLPEGTYQIIIWIDRKCVSAGYDKYFVIDIKGSQAWIPPNHYDAGWWHNLVPIIDFSNPDAFDELYKLIKRAIAFKLRER